MTNDQNLEKYQEIIDKILGGIQLNNEEKSIVDNDASFKEYRKEFDLIQKGISHSVLENKLEDMSKLEEKYQNEKPKSRGLSRRSYLLLAAASILLLLAYFMFNNSGGGSYDGDLLAADSLIPFSTGYETRSAEDNTNVDSSYVNFINGKFREATTDLEERIELDKNPKHKFFLALSHLQRDKWKAAEKILEDNDLINSKDYPINFYLAISKVGQKKTTEAIELLEKPASGSFVLHKQRSEKLLKKLKAKL